MIARMGTQWFDKVKFAANRPDLTIRRLRGLPVSEVSLDELNTHIPDAPVIVEAGACDGTDTLRFVARWPSAEIHAFEPVPSAYQDVTQRTKDLPQVRTYQFALADRSGRVPMFVSEDEAGGHRPDSSSLLAPTGHLAAWPSIVFRESVQVEGITLTDWVAREGITRIDLMWLDLQGMELRVLQASPDVLRMTTAVYLEAWRREYYAGAGLYDEILSWMKRQGFRPAIDRVSRVFGNVLFVNERG